TSPTVACSRLSQTLPAAIWSRPIPQRLRGIARVPLELRHTCLAMAPGIGARGQKDRRGSLGARQHEAQRGQPNRRFFSARWTGRLTFFLSSVASPAPVANPTPIAGPWGAPVHDGGACGTPIPQCARSERLAPRSRWLGGECVVAKFRMFHVKHLGRRP